MVPAYLGPPISKPAAVTISGGPYKVCPAWGCGPMPPVVSIGATLTNGVTSGAGTQAPVFNPDPLGTGRGFDPIVTLPTKGTVAFPSQPPDGGQLVTLGAPETGVGSQNAPAYQPTTQSSYSYAQVVTDPLSNLKNIKIPGWAWLVGLGIIIYIWLD